MRLTGRHPLGIWIISGVCVVFSVAKRRRFSQFDLEQIGIDLDRLEFHFLGVRAVSDQHQPVAGPRSGCRRCRRRRRAPGSSFHPSPTTLSSLPTVPWMSSESGGTDLRFVVSESVCRSGPGGISFHGDLQQEAALGVGGKMEVRRQRFHGDGEQLRQCRVGEVVVDDLQPLGQAGIQSAPLLASDSVCERWGNTTWLGSAQTAAATRPEMVNLTSCREGSVV